MKYTNYLLLLGCMAVMTACASTQAPLTLQAVGPAPDMETHSIKTGYLMVYSAWLPSANIDRHSPYSVTSADGSFNQSVKNYLDMYDGGPVRLALPVGSYQVKTSATHLGKVIVPVRIEAGRTTSVYLDGYPHFNQATAPSADVVKTPKGAIIGYAAKSSQ